MRVSKIFLLGVTFTLIAGSVPSASAEPEAAPRQTRLATVSGGAGVIIADWSSSAFGVNEFLDYDLDTNLFTQVEGGFAINRLGLSLGINLDLDNNAIAESHKYMGYLGFKRMMLRGQSGKLSGTARWSGLLGTGQSRDSKFESKFTNIDVLYWFKSFAGASMPWYLGAGYTSYAIPTELKVYNAVNGGEHYHQLNSIFDPDFEMKMYDLVFGFDTFSGAMMFPNQKDIMEVKNGWGILFSTEDRFGFGKNAISDKALAAARELNPAYPKVVGDNKAYFLVENDTALGVKWTGNIGSGKISLGVGYAIAFIYGNGFNKGNGAANEQLLTPENSLFRSGPIFRMNARW